MKNQTFFIILVLLFFSAIVYAEYLKIDTKKATYFNDPRSCPRGYELARLNTIELWREGIHLATKLLGNDKRVWVRQALNWSGAGYEEWMIATPTDPKKCFFPPENLKTFCIPNEHGKLIVNRQWRRKLPNICIKLK